MKVAIYGQSISDINLQAFEELVGFLEENKCEVHVESEFLALLKTHKHFITYSALNTTYDLLVSIGGDGTILRAITFVRESEIPVVGINTGRLGFLATIQLPYLQQAMTSILNKDFRISRRNLLEVETSIKVEEIEQTNFALNEIAISRKNTTSMITVETHLNSEYLTTYWADGLILSTPTGSTGYSLSCGGPVITPESDNFVLTPIAPHNLSARPLVINNDTTVKLKVAGREDQFLISLDSRIVTLPNDCEITVKKAGFNINLIELKNESFLDTLRKKLLWGEDRRN